MQTLMTCTEWSQPGLHSPDSSFWLLVSIRLPNAISHSGMVFIPNNLHVEKGGLAYIYIGK